MADQATLQKLMETVKASRSFEGFKEKDLQEACASFANRSNADVEVAIEKFRKEEEDLEKEEKEKTEALVSSQQKLVETHQAEVLEQKKDQSEAEKLLDKLFK